jgi:hypothetical protein
MASKDSPKRAYLISSPKTLDKVFNSYTEHLFNMNNTNNSILIFGE